MDRSRARAYLKSFEFRKLFLEELGWDSHRQPLTVTVDSQEYQLQAVAQKRGVVALQLPVSGTMPDHATRRKIERQVGKLHREHMIIYTDRARGEQVWQWVRQEPGKPLASREHHYNVAQPGDALLQKLEQIEFSLDEEAGIVLVDVTSRIRSAFDVEKTTKKFYDQFKKERDAFEKFLKGIPDADLARWYVSVMMNRLMFVYFIQKKGFLDGDLDYLQNRLAQSQKQGDDRYYRDFLCPLFFEGFARPEAARSAATQALLGQVPFLNGGIFQRHEVEQLHGATIQIPDQAFARLFAFFGQYQWHLDERPLRQDNEINPDVLGYIFEKYINQKQMGAYYTKEDITDYISKNTIIPFLFDRARREYAPAFEGDNSVWKLLESDPDRYIYPAMRKGATLPLPQEIASGIGDVSQRTLWNTRTPDEYALPTEIWRETVARRQRYEEVWLKLAGGEVQETNDLITYNLDIRQFAQDVIEACDDAHLLRAFWTAITTVTVLDPTCGSGAFLFAALNILEPLYEACLERMAVLVEEMIAGASDDRVVDFMQVLAEIERHPSAKYFIYKSIVVNNLYGVDIMAEAVEIAKLRLFLKLVAQVERVEDVEPLPDIDFNIRAGNTLVGFTSLEQVEEVVRGGRLLLLPEDEALLTEIKDEAEQVDGLFSRFREMQTFHDAHQWGEDYTTTKGELRRRLSVLEDRLNRLLALQYGVNPNKLEYEPWLRSHQPFHWLVEFYGIMRVGGFDVAFGNPPYLTLRSSLGYLLIGYRTLNTQNLYAIVLERCQGLITEFGRQGYIVPVSSMATEGYLSLQTILASRRMFVSSYDDRPSHLFTGLDKNTLSIILLSEPVSVLTAHSTRLNRWNTHERDFLFQTLTYHQINKTQLPGCIQKTGQPIESRLWDTLFSRSQRLAMSYAWRSGRAAYYSRKVNAFLQVLDFTPIVRDRYGNVRPPSEFKTLEFSTDEEATIVFACLNSTLFRWFVDVVSDGSHLNRRELDNLPLSPMQVARSCQSLIILAQSLSQQLQATSEYRVMMYSHDTLTIQCIFPRRAKSVIDDIDRELARYFAMTDEELDFIINYDIKYRMGDELTANDQDE